jgi:hypothetical protein
MIQEEFMTLTELLTIIALILNFGALVVVTVQTIFTRNALNAARTSIESGRKARQLEILPRANFIISVQNDLSSWEKELSNSAEQLRNASQREDPALFKKIASEGLQSPNGLINRYMFDHSPNWLAVLWVTSAQYYYIAKGAQTYLWKDQTNEANFSYAQMMLSRFSDSIEGIRRSSAYISDTVPNFYLESPASLNDEDFLTSK